MDALTSTKESAVQGGLLSLVRKGVWGRIIHVYVWLGQSAVA